MSHVKTDKLSARTASGTITLGESGETFSLPSGTTLNIASGAVISNAGTQSGFGKVLQVVQTVKTDTFSYTGATFTDVTGLSASITPFSTSNKILVLMTINGSASNRYSAIRLLRDSTDIFIGDAASNRTRVTIPIDSNHDETSQSYIARNMGLTYLDSPSTTSSVTYKIQIANTTSSSYTTYINRPPIDGDYDYTTRSASNIVLMEIAG